MNAGEQSIVADWLRTLGLPQYAESFVDNGYDDLEICKQIGEPDLDAIGVSDPRHRERVLQAVRVLLEQGGTAVYFTLEEAARHSRAAAEYGFAGGAADCCWATDKAAARPDSLRYFSDEYEEGKAELVRFPKMQLKIMVRDKTVRDGIRLSTQPYSNPDGSRGDLDGLARRYAEELKTHFQDVLERLEELRRRRVAADFAQLPDAIDYSLGYKAPRFYRPGKYMPSSCLNELEDDTGGADPYGLYDVRLASFSGAGSPQRCLSPRSKYFYEPCPFSASECKDPSADPGRGVKKAAGGFGRLFRTLGSKKDKCKTSPRHLSGRLRPAAGTSRTGASSGRSTTEAPLSPAAGLSSFAPAATEEEVLNDDRCLQLVLAVREGQMTSEQALHRLRQRETLRLRNHRNREELLNDLARNFVFSQGTSKKANSVFYTDGGCLPSVPPSSCRVGGGAMPGVPASQPIYYEPPDAVDLDSCAPAVAAPLGVVGSPLRGAAPTPAVASSDRCCVSAPGHSVIASPFRTKAPPILAAPPYGSGTTTTEVCDGNCGNIMCSVRASADSPPSEPATTTLLPALASDKTVNDEDGTTTTTAAAGENEDGVDDDVNDAASRTVPDVAHDSELKRAALAAAAASAAVGSDNARAPTPGAPGVAGSVAAGVVTSTTGESSANNVRSVTMLGKLRGITQQNRNSFSASEEGHSQSSDYEDQEDVEKQMGEAQKTQDQQLRNSLVGRVRHLHKDVKKKISRFRNSRSSVDGSDDKDMADDSLHPGSSIESIPGGSAGSRSSIQAHTPTSSNRSSSSIGEEECNPQCFGPFVGRARALVDCVPSPYDKDGLSFKKGDIIDILSRNTTGTWVGVANKKVGHFKFINVEEIPMETKPRQRRFPSVPKLDRRPESLEELLGMFGLQNYLNVFMLHGYQDFEMFKEVTKDDLDSLGITNEDHQLQIFRAAETLLEHDGEILGEYLEVPVSPDLPAVKEGDADGIVNTAINDLDSVADSIPQNDRKSTFVLPSDCDASFTNNGPVRFQLNIPLAEPDVPTTTAQPARDIKESICNGTDVTSMTVFSGPLPERFELRRASADCIRSHLPRSLQNVFRKFSGNTGEEDGRSASFDENETLSESPAKVSYGSSFARKVKASSFLRRDSAEEGSMGDVLGKKGSRGKGGLDNVEESAPLSLRACIEHKLAAEGIDLCQEPYTDRTGFCGIPPALVQRYSEELQKDIADTAEALDQVRISELDRIGKRGVPNDFLADSCGGPVVEADYSGLRAWLVSLGLPMYEPLFLEARISTLARVADLREPDFRTLGISNARHVRLLSSAVGALHFEQSRYSLEVR
ncbi:unnamed protein product [Ixodes hexagonus]